MTSRFSLFFSIAFAFLFFSSCSDMNKESATMIIHGGTIYTVDASQATVEAVAVKDFLSNNGLSYTEVSFDEYTEETEDKMFYPSLAM